MPGVYLVTDSSCDLAEDEIGPFDIEIVPLTIRFGDEEFTDRHDLSVEAFYEAALANGGRDNGRPGLRADNGPNYYAAYVVDPDGYRIGLFHPLH